MKQRSGLVLFATVTVLVAAAVGGCSKPPEPVVLTPATPAATPAPDATAAGSNVSDVDVTAHVKTALQQNDSLKGFDISVTTLKGDVRLTGMVDSQAQIDEATKIARAADGAHAVHDELTIKK